MKWLRWFKKPEPVPEKPKRIDPQIEYLINRLKRTLEDVEKELDRQGL